MRSIVICPNNELRGTLETMAGQYPAIRIAKSLDQYPDAEHLRRLVRMWAPSIIFLSVEHVDCAVHVCKLLNGEFPSLQTIGLSLTEEPDVLRLALEQRMAGLLSLPLEQARFEQTLRRLADHLEAHPSDAGNPGQVYAFMPAKGGSGASTIASNAARAFAHVEGAHVLLADLDISSGVAGFMFNAEHNFSVHDAGQRNKELDDQTWERLVKKVGNVDLLLSGAPRMDEAIPAEGIPPLLDFARRSYSVVAADLADTFDDRTLAVLRESNRIFLVTTPDLASLRMARLKAGFLRKMEWEDKTKLLLNRVTKRMELETNEIEAMVGMPVFASFPCNYADVTRSVRNAESSPKLAASIKQFVDKVEEKKVPQEKRTRFIERFAVVPGRYGFR